MTYKVMGVGDGWIELWDQTSLVSPDLPRNKALDKFFIGEHPFQVNDIVELSVRLVARVIPPTEELVDALVPFFQENGDKHHD
jgi:hypothetical protein